MNDKSSTLKSEQDTIFWHELGSTDQAGFMVNVTC